MIEKENCGDFNDIDFDKTEEWFSIAQDEIYNKNRIKTIFVIIISISISIILSLFYEFSYFIVGFFIFGLYAGKYYDKPKKEFFVKLAKQNKLIYKNECFLGDLKTRLLEGSIGASRNVLIGNYQGRRARFFNSFVAKEGSGVITFFEVFLDGLELPYTLLLFHRKERLGVEGRYDKKLKNEIKINLEDEFSKYYSLYIEDGYGIEAMQIFNKEFLSFLVNEKCDFSIELNKDRLYIYTADRVMKKKQIREFFETANETIKRIEPLITRLKRDFYNLKKQYNLND